MVSEVFINGKEKLCLLKYSLPVLRLRGDPTVSVLWPEKGHMEEDLTSLCFPSNLVQDWLIKLEGNYLYSQHPSSYLFLLKKKSGNAAL